MAILPDWLTSAQYRGGLLGNISAPSEIAEPSFLGRLKRGLSDNSMALIGLGAGIAQGGLGRGLRMAMPGAAADEQARKTRNNQAAIAQALRRKGLSPTEVAAAVASPELAKVLISRAYPKLPLQRAEQLPFDSVPQRHTPPTATSKFENQNQDQLAERQTSPSQRTSPGPLDAGTIEQTDDLTSATVSRMQNDSAKSAPVISYAEALPFFQSMIRSQPGSADMDLAYGVVKIFDPNSVVRPGEMKLGGKSKSLPEDVQAMIKRVAFGEGQLTPQNRSRLLEVARARVSELQQSMP